MLKQVCDYTWGQQKDDGCIFTPNDEEQELTMSLTISLGRQRVWPVWHSDFLQGHSEAWVCVPFCSCQALELGAGSQGSFHSGNHFRSINWMETKAGPMPCGYCFTSRRCRLHCRLPRFWTGMPRWLGPHGESRVYRHLVATFLVDLIGRKATLQEKLLPA